VIIVLYSRFLNQWSTGGKVFRCFLKQQTPLENSNSNMHFLIINSSNRVFKYLRSAKLCQKLSKQTLKWQSTERHACSFSLSQYQSKDIFFWKRQFKANILANVDLVYNNIMICQFKNNTVNFTKELLTCDQNPRRLQQYLGRTTLPEVDNWELGRSISIGFLLGWVEDFRSGVGCLGRERLSLQEQR